MYVISSQVSINYFLSTCIINRCNKKNMIFSPCRLTHMKPAPSIKQRTRLPQLRKFTVLLILPLVVLLISLQKCTQGANIANKLISKDNQTSKYVTAKGSKVDKFLNDVFPVGFKWGVGSSAFQIEGGYQENGKLCMIYVLKNQGHVSFKNLNSQSMEDLIFITFTPSLGKGQSIWDKFTQDSPDNASVSCDSYHKYKEDVLLVKSTGVRVHFKIIF